MNHDLFSDMARDVIVNRFPIPCMVDVRTSSFRIFVRDMVGPHAELSVIDDASFDLVAPRGCLVRNDAGSTRIAAGTGCLTTAGAGPPSITVAGSVITGMAGAGGPIRSGRLHGSPGAMTAPTAVGPRCRPTPTAGRARGFISEADGYITATASA